MIFIPLSWKITALQYLSLALIFQKLEFSKIMNYELALLNKNRILFLNILINVSTVVFQARNVNP